MLKVKLALIMAHECKKGKDCKCAMYDGYYKKAMVVNDLIYKLYGDKLLKLATTPGGFTDIIFKNKPDQRLRLSFTCMDTWDKIKQKFAKLMESDGICVVCCEMEKGRKKMVKRPCQDCDCGHTERVVEIDSLTSICQSCTDYVCCKCINTMDGLKCPICRECMRLYKHKYEKERCDCEEEWGQ
jgi:hypothetical protein